MLSLRERIEAFVEAYAPADELNRARFKRDLSQVLEVFAQDDVGFEPIDRVHDQSIAAVRNSYGNPSPGTWHSRSKDATTPVGDMADGHLINVARRLLFGPIDLRREGRELTFAAATRRCAAFFWIFEEIARRGRQNDSGPEDLRCP